MAIPCFVFVSDETGETELLDITGYISELNIVHNDVDAEGSGRDAKTGKMKRTRIAQKHTLNVKLRRIGSAVARSIFAQVEGQPDFYVKYLRPCANSVSVQHFYCASVNYGAQRYNRDDGGAYYDGATFNCIQI